MCPGNHDEFLRNYYGTHFGGIDVVENTVHEGVDGRRYLVDSRRYFRPCGAGTALGSGDSDTAYDFAIPRK